MPIQKISKEEYQSILDLALASREILEDDRFQFIRDYFNSNKEYTEKSILNGTITDVKETITVSERITRTFFTPKKVQIDELVGQYKLINKFFEDLRMYIKNKENLDRELSEKKVRFKDEPTSL